MGFAGLVLILTIVVVVFGATKLPSLGDGLSSRAARWRDQRLRAERFRRVFRRGRLQPRTFSEWLLVVVAIALGAIVISNAVAAALGKR
jgi:hypothetical protein